MRPNHASYVFSPAEGGLRGSSFPGSSAHILYKILFKAEYKPSVLHEIYILEKLSVQVK